jgi:hypothetical protein
LARARLQCSTGTYSTSWRVTKSVTCTAKASLAPWPRPRRGPALVALASVGLCSGATTLVVMAGAGPVAAAVLGVPRLDGAVLLSGLPSASLPGHGEGPLGPNVRVGSATSPSGRRATASAHSTALTRTSPVSVKSAPTSEPGARCAPLDGPPVRVSGPIGALLGDSSPPPGMVATYQPNPGEPVRELIYQRPRDINPPKGAPPVINPPYLRVYVRLTTMSFSQLFDMHMTPTMIGGHKAVLGYLPPPVGSWTAAWRASPSTVVFVQSNLPKSQFLSSAAGVFYSSGTLPPLLPAPRGEVPLACRRLPGGALPARRVIRLYSARGLGVQVKLVRFSQLAKFADGLSGDPGNAVPGLVVWLVLEQAPDNHLVGDMCQGPVCKFPAGPSWVMFPVDAATGVRFGYTASGMGKQPGYWGALVDLAP